MEKTQYEVSAANLRVSRIRQSKKINRRERRGGRERVN